MIYMKNNFSHWIMRKNFSLIYFWKFKRVKNVIILFFKRRQYFSIFILLLLLFLGERKNISNNYLNILCMWTQQFFYKYFSSMMYIFSKSHLLPHLMLLCEEISLVWLARQGHMTRKRLCKGMPAEKRLLGCGKNKSYKKKNCCRKTDIPGWKG